MSAADAAVMANLAQLGEWLPDARSVGDLLTGFARVHSDTRSLAAGDLFVALKGDHFDANEMLAEARAHGAVAAIAHHGLAEAGLPGFEVTDTLAALGQLAAGWRTRFDLPLIAVTGSNGKTTVTQMIASILKASAGERALATAGNFNNEIGLPLTLLRLRPADRLAVVELGMNHPGEIARLAAIAQPTVALVNNAQREHQEFMASVEAVALENAAVFASLPPDGTAVFPAGDVFSALWRRLGCGEGAPRRCLSFGEGADTDADIALVAAEARDSGWRLEVGTPLGAIDFELRMPGRHNVANALAAIACTLAAGVSLKSIAQGLERFEAVKGRSSARILRLPSDRMLTLVDDSYNANPDSVRAAIDLLATLPAPRLLVLGDMGEVGSEGVRFHAEVGAYARERGIDRLFAIGPDSANSVSAFAGSHEHHFADIDALNASVCSQLEGLGSVLVKGSRFMKMERVVQVIEANAFDRLDQEAGYAA